METLQVLLTLAAVALAAVYLIRQSLTRDGCTGCSGRCSTGSELVPLSAIENSADSASRRQTPLTNPAQED